MPMAERLADQGMNPHLFRPTVWEAVKPFYEWADRKAVEAPFFPLPNVWAFGHMS